MISASVISVVVLGQSAVSVISLGTVTRQHFLSEGAL